jgi:hypothetical protein
MLHPCDWICLYKLDNVKCLFMYRSHFHDRGGKVIYSGYLKTFRVICQLMHFVYSCYCYMNVWRCTSFRIVLSLAECLQPNSSRLMVKSKVYTLKVEPIHSCIVTDDSIHCSAVSSALTWDCIQLRWYHLLHSAWWCYSLCSSKLCVNMELCSIVDVSCSIVTDDSIHCTAVSSALTWCCMQ